MGQTQPLTRSAGPSLTPGASAITAAPTKLDTASDDGAGDAASMPLAAGALVISLAALGVVFWLYQAVNAAG